MDIKQLIGETTDYDKKVALETKKPKSWCKSISAFANCYGGKLVFGVARGHVIRITDNEGTYIVGCRMLEDNKAIYDYVNQNYHGE